MPGGTVEPAGRHRASCDTDRRLRVTLSDFTPRSVTPGHRRDQAIQAWGTGGNTEGRSRIELNGRTVVLIEGQWWRRDFGTRRTYAFGPVTVRAGRRTVRSPKGSRVAADPPARPLTAPDRRPAPLVSLFVPKEEPAPGRCGELIYWREL